MSLSLLSRTHQTQNGTHHTLLIVTSDDRITHGFPGWGWRGGGLTAKGHKATFWCDENGLCVDCGGGYMSVIWEAIFFFFKA